MGQEVVLVTPDKVFETVQKIISPDGYFHGYYRERIVCIRDLPDGSVMIIKESYEEPSYENFPFHRFECKLKCSSCEEDDGRRRRSW